MRNFEHPAHTTAPQNRQWCFRLNTLNARWQHLCTIPRRNQIEAWGGATMRDCAPINRTCNYPWYARRPKRGPAVELQHVCASLGCCVDYNKNRAKQSTTITHRRTPTGATTHSLRFSKFFKPRFKTMDCCVELRRPVPKLALSLSKSSSEASPPQKSSSSPNTMDSSSLPSLGPSPPFATLRRSWRSSAAMASRGRDPRCEGTPKRGRHGLLSGNPSAFTNATHQNTSLTDVSL